MRFSPPREGEFWAGHLPGSGSSVAAAFARRSARIAIACSPASLPARALEQVIDEGDKMLQGQGAVILPIVALVMILVGLLAALGPARAGLKIQPIEALREE